MLRQLRLSELAKADMEEIWLWTAQKFDIEQAIRYQMLLNQALDDIRLDPARASSQTRPDLGSQIRSYRVALSKARSGTRVKSSRHTVFYTLESQNETLVLRILHDAMNVSQYLPGAP